MNQFRALCSQFLTLLWMRRRIGVNVFRRIAPTFAKLGTFFAALLALAVISSFFTALVMGLALLPQVNANVVLIIWSSASAGFLFFWMTGLMAELQRGDSVSLQPMLHLPVSLTSAFLLNYFGSWMTLASVMFMPTLAALAVASVFARGARMALLPLLLLGFFLLITGATHQLRGWMATLMTNPRRRRNVIAMIVVGFVVLAQAPNLVTLWFVRDVNRGDTLTRNYVAESESLRQQLTAGEISLEEFEAATAKAAEDLAQGQTQGRQDKLILMRDRLVLAVALLPPGWLALGAWSLEHHHWAQVAGCLLGLYGLAALCLWRSYRLTLRYYLGDYSHGAARRAEPALAGAAAMGHAVAGLPVASGTAAAAPATSPAKLRPAGAMLIERRLPWLSEHVAVVVLATWQNLIRATEVRLMLMSPLAMVVVMGSIVMRGSKGPANPDLHPLMSLAAIGISIVSALQISQNQFGLDRAGFRAWVLSPIDRRDLLLGKNIVVWLFGVAFGLIGLLISAIVWPLQPLDLAAAGMQMFAALLVLAVVGNQTSILAPLLVKSGGMESVHPKLGTVFLQLAFALLLPLALSPIVLPAASRLLLQGVGWSWTWTVNPLASAGLLGACLLVYAWALPKQARLLMRRERDILQVVAGSIER